MPRGTLPKVPFDSLPGEVVDSDHRTIYSIDDQGRICFNWTKPYKWESSFPDAIFETFRLGLGYRQAANIINRTVESLYTWMLRGHVLGELLEEGRTLHPKCSNIGKFYLDLEQGRRAAEIDGIKARLARIDASQDWRAAAWLLERTTEEFREQPKRVNLTIDLTQLNDDDLARLAETGKL